MRDADNPNEMRVADVSSAIVGAVWWCVRVCDDDGDMYDDAMHDANEYSR